MSVVDGVENFLLHTAQWFADLLARLGDSRGQGQAWAQSESSPWIEVAGLPDIAWSEPDLTLIPKLLAVIEGVRAAIRASDGLSSTELTEKEVIERELEMLLRVVFPVLNLALHKSTDSPIANIVIEIVQLLDSRLAENASGLSVARYVQLYRSFDKEVFDGQDRLLFAFAAVAPALFFLAKIGKVERWLKHYELTLNGGWESAQLDRGYSTPETWRDTPTWMAQRTTSLTFQRKPIFKLDRYAKGTPSEPDVGVGFTVVPIPAKRTAQADVPAPSGVPVGDAGGPAVWLQIDASADYDIPLDRNLTLKLRGLGAVGFVVPLGGQPLTGNGNGGVEITTTWTKTPETKPATTAGAQGGLSVHADAASVSFAFGGAANSNDWALGLKVTKLNVALSPGDGVLSAIMHRGLSLTSDLAIGVSKNGLAFQGANGLDLYVDTKVSVPLPFALTGSITYLRFSGIYQPESQRTQIDSEETDTQSTTVGVQVTAGFELAYDKVKLILDGIGGKLIAQTNDPHGNLLGLAQLDADLVTPTGLGLQVNFSDASGGGFFSHDPITNRYTGGLELGFGKRGPTGQRPVTVRGVGFVERRAALPSQTEGDATALAILTGEYKSWGLGVMLALHRGIDVDAIVAALPTGAIDALLFPPDPLSKSTQIAAALATMFPPALASADKHVLGLFGKHTWFAGLAMAAVGLLAEFGGAWASWPTKVIAPGTLRVGKAGRTQSVLWVEIDGVLAVDIGKRQVELHAVLRNSRFLGAELVGGTTLFYGDPFDDDNLDSERGLFLSSGGYHPSYYGGTGPQRAAVASRNGFVLRYGNNILFEVKLYIARTPGIFHLGILGHAHIGAAGFELDGKLWVDALVHSHDNFIASIGGSFSLILFSETICALEFVGEWKHTPEKKSVSGEVKFKVLWWSVTKHADEPLSTEMANDSPPEDVHALLAATLDDAASFPNAMPGDVVLASGARAGVWNAPEQPFAFVQSVAPLDTPIDRMNATSFASPLTLTRGDVTLAGHVVGVAVATTEFAPAAYLDLDTDAALHAPVGELWPAGFVTEDLGACGDSYEMTATYDEITVDRAQLVPPIPPPKRPFPRPGALVTAWSAVGVSPATTRIAIARPTYASSLAQAPTTFAGAWARRGPQIRRKEDA